MGLSDNTKLLWAKKNDNDWLPLYTHLYDTATAIEFIWDKWVRVSVRNDIIEHVRLSGETDSRTDEFLKTLKLVALLHDIGKATPEFQIKAVKRFPGSRLCSVGQRLIDTGYMADDAESFKRSHAEIPHAKAGCYLLKEMKFNKSIQSIVGAHHGLPTIPDSNARPKMNESVYYYDDQHREIWKNSREELVCWALELSGYKDIDSIPYLDGVAQMWVTGILIMADWIASNEDYFPLIPMNQTECNNYEERFSAHTEKLLDFLNHGWNYNGVSQTTESKTFEKRFGFAPNDMQKTVNGVANKISSPGIIVIEAPMGQGKTEAALSACDILARRFNKSGIFFALPSQATSDGMFVRIENFIRSYDGTSASLKLMHGKAEFNKDYTDLRKSQNVDIDGSDDSGLGTIEVNEWFEGRKKSLLADFVVGTVDQLLMASLIQKHVMLRHVGLANKVVVVDEVHAYDAFMNQYLERTLSWLGAYEVPVVLLSATLPFERKNRLVSAYMNNAEAIQPDYAAALPRITYTDKQSIETINFPKSEQQNTVKLSYVSETDIVETVNKKMANGGCVGIILNTVSRAQQLYRLLRASDISADMLLIHSEFLPSDRIRIESQIRELLGKPSDKRTRRPERCIVVGTQVLEQSLDIDFDLLITDMSPVDLLLQRIGRLHRHNRVRPSGLDNPECYIISRGDEKDTSELIYGRYLLKRTKEVLNYKDNTILIPEDMPDLIEDVYDRADAKSEFNAEREEWLKEINNSSDKPKSFLIKAPESATENNKIERKLSDIIDSRIITDDKEGEARVRDTDGSVEVTLIKQIGNEYFTLTGNSRLSYTDGNGITNDAARDLSSDTLRLPHMLTHQGIISMTIHELTEITDSVPEEIRNNSWLSNRLLLPLNDRCECSININKINYKVGYNNQEGLIVGKEEK